MRPCLPVVAALVTACVAPHVQTPGAAPCWSRQLPVTGEVFTAFAARGELTIAGTFGPAIDVGDGAIASAGEHDPIVARYRRDGALIWRSAFGGPSDESTGALAVDARGDVVVTGSVPSGCFVTKLAGADGHVRWTKTVTVTGDHQCRAIAAGERDVFVAGSFDAEVDFGDRMVSRGKNDIWVAAFATADGTLHWTHQIGGAGNDIVRALAVDAHGDVFLGGQFSGEVPPADGAIDLGAGPLHAAGYFDGLIAKLTASGTVVWARGFGDVGFDIVKSIAVDHDGSAVVSGAWMRPQDFRGAIPILTGVMDGLLARYNADGTLAWRRVFPGGGSQAHHVALGDDGRIWVSGHFNSRVDLGGRALSSTEKSAAYIAAFSPDGAPVLAQLIGAPTAQFGYTIASGPDGAVAVAFGFAGTTQFCGRSVISASPSATLVGVMTPERR